MDPDPAAVLMRIRIQLNESCEIYLAKSFPVVENYEKAKKDSSNVRKHGAGPNLLGKIQLLPIS